MEEMASRSIAHEASGWETRDPYALIVRTCIINNAQCCYSVCEEFTTKQWETMAHGELVTIIAIIAYASVPAYRVLCMRCDGAVVCIPGYFTPSSIFKTFNEA
jgi:hypothetical protein